MAHFRSITLFTLLTLLLFGTVYPLFMYGIGRLFPHRSDGLPLYHDGRVVGYENIGQSFYSSGYFWGRPSAVGYNAAATGGSNKGPSNPEFLAAVQSRIDTLLKYHPGLKPADLPVELVTASGSGLDPHISLQAAQVQASRVASARGLPEERLLELIKNHTEGPLWGLFGPAERINVLRLNLALDSETNGRQASEAPGK